MPRLKVAVSLLAVVSAGLVGAAEKPDCRVRTLVDPVRIVATSPGLGADELCGPRHGQVSEGVFCVGSGPVLGTNLTS